MTRTTEPVAALAAVTRLLRRHLAQQPTVQRALPNALLAEAEAPPLRQDVVEELGHQLQALLLSAGADKAAARLPGLLTKLTAAVEMMACARPRPRPRSRDTFTSTSTIRITRAGVHDHVHVHVHEGEREWRPAGRWLGVGGREHSCTVNVYLCFYPGASGQPAGAAGKSCRHTGHILPVADPTTCNSAASRLAHLLYSVTSQERTMKCTLAKTAAILLVLTTATPALAQAPWNDSPIRRFVVYWSWLWFAGHGLNSTTLNGELPDGSKVTSVGLSGVKVKGKAMKKVLLRGTRFWGVSTHGKVAGPWAFTGARFFASVDDGTSLDLRVDRVYRGKEKKIRDILYYEVSYQDSSQWRPLCGSDSNGDPVPAIPLRGAWSYKRGVTGGGSRLSTPGVFTFACVGHVLAKCAEGGYRPWMIVKRCS